MGKALVLAEKPSVARDLAGVLGLKRKGNGFIEGPDYIVTWALGHLVTLAEPEAYDDRYKSWRIEDLPMLPEKMKLTVIRETSKQFKIVRSLINRDDVNELILATDSGREGELVGRWIFEKAGTRKPIKRLWISSQTEKAIKDGFNSLKPGKDYENLYKSAQCRAEADWLVGLNVTRALTCKYNAQLSAGRVQTPTLAMIVQREREIASFVPKDYWTLNINVKGFSLQWRDKKSGQSRIFSKEQAEKLLARVKSGDLTVTEIKRDAREEPPPLAYDLTELQRDANKRFNYSAKQTLDIMQSLYERHKILTYPRTDSRHITTDIIPTLPERLRSIAVGPYTKAARELLKSKLNVTKRFADNSKVTDHHAIIPTEQSVNFLSLNNEERNIFDLVVKRFLAVLSSPFSYEQTTIKAEVAGEVFTAKGKIVKSKGWKTVEDNDDDESEEEKDQNFPIVKKGDILDIISAEMKNGKTKPPARYNEATLLSAMEHPGKFIENDELRATMDKTGGLGTPATRADIIEKLFNSFYIDKRGREIYPTSKGIQLIELVPEDLKSPELTAVWEKKLNLIREGKVMHKDYISEIKKYSTKLVSDIIASRLSYRHNNLTRERCPECGKYMLDVKGKKGQMLICQDRECGFRKTVSIQSNARCPECHKKMEIRGEGQNKNFYCSCGYRERLDAFSKRKTEQVSKREVTNYLRQQNKENSGSVNDALKMALKNIKIKNNK